MLRCDVRRLTGAALVSFLIENGADPTLKVEPPAKQAGKDSFQWTDLSCAKIGDSCADLKDALEDATSR